MAEHFGGEERGACDSQAASAAGTDECHWVSEYLPVKALARSGSHCSTRSNSPAESFASLRRTSFGSLCMSDATISSRPSACYLEEGLSASTPTAGEPRSARGFGRLRGGPFASAVFTLASSAMGAGCLSLPFMLRSCGIASGLLMLLLGAGLAHLSLTVLMDGAVRTGCSRMAQLVAPSPSDGTGVLVDVAMATYGISAVLCLLIFCGDFFSGVARSPLLGLDVSRESLIALISAFVVWPLSLGRGVSALRHVSVLSVAAICITAVIVACKAPAYAASRVASAAPEDQALRWWSSDPSTLLQAFSISIFAFAAHTNAVPVAHSLAHSGGSSSQIARVSLCSVCIELAVYSLVAVGGCISFGPATKQNFILNYPDDDPMIFFVRCISGAAVCFGAPINLNPAATSIIGLLSGNSGKQASRSLHVLVVTLSIVGCACVAICSESVADVIGFIGASLGTLIVLAWPASVYRRVLARSHPPRLARAIFRTLACAAALGFAAFACQLHGAISAQL